MLKVLGLYWCPRRLVRIPRIEDKFTSVLETARQRMLNQPPPKGVTMLGVAVMGLFVGAPALADPANLDHTQGC